jgi:pimeloyl-ACP methyl ester carboxylesterase
MPFRGPPKPAPTWFPPPLARRWNEGGDAITKTLKRMRTARRIDPSRRLRLPFEPVELRTDDGVRLAAWFVNPTAPRPDGLMAVVHHHYGGQKATVLPWLSLLHELAVPAIAIDGRGHAESDPSPPGRGSFGKRAADARAACEFVVGRGARRLLGVGQSQGAASLAIGLAGREDLAGVVLDCGPAPEMGTAAWGLAGNVLGDAADDRLARALLAARILPGTEPVAYPPLLWSALFRLRSVPLLWLHGDRDEVIRRSWSAAWFHTLRGPSWQALRVPGADHVRTLQEGGTAVASAVSDFVRAL